MQLYSQYTIYTHYFPDKRAGHNGVKLIIIYQQTNIDESHKFKCHY